MSSPSTDPAGRTFRQRMPVRTPPSGTLTPCRIVNRHLPEPMQGAMMMEPPLRLRYHLPASIVAIVAAALCGCGGSRDQRESGLLLRRIEVDDRHFQVIRLDGSEPEIYRISPGDGLVVDAGSYRFPIPANRTWRGVNAVQLAMTGGGIFSARWSAPEKRAILSKKTLIPRTHWKFHGLHSGDTLVLGIGREVDTNGRADFHPVWYALGVVE